MQNIKVINHAGEMVVIGTTNALAFLTAEALQRIEPADPGWLKLVDTKNGNITLIPMGKVEYIRTETGNTRLAPEAPKDESDIPAWVVETPDEEEAGADADEEPAPSARKRK